MTEIGINLPQQSTKYALLRGIISSAQRLIKLLMELKKSQLFLALRKLSLSSNFKRHQRIRKNKSLIIQ
jgi:hypothetical protein